MSYQLCIPTNCDEPTTYTFVEEDKAIKWIKKAKKAISECNNNCIDDNEGKEIEITKETVIVK